MRSLFGLRGFLGVTSTIVILVVAVNGLSIKRFLDESSGAKSKDLAILLHPSLPFNDGLPPNKNRLSSPILPWNDGDFSKVPQKSQTSSIEHENDFVIVPISFFIANAIPDKNIVTINQKRLNPYKPKQNDFQKQKRGNGVLEDRQSSSPFTGMYSYNNQNFQVGSGVVNVNGPCNSPFTGTSSGLSNINLFSGNNIALLGGKVNKVCSPSTLPQVSNPTVPQIASQSVPQLSPPKIPQISTSEIPQTIPQTAPQQNSEQIASQTVSAISIPSVPQVPAPEIPQTSAQSISQNTSQMASQMAAQIASQTASQISAASTPPISTPTLPQTIPQSASQISQESVPQTISQDASQNSKQSIPQITATTTPMMSTPTVPSIIPQTSPQSIPQTNPQIVSASSTALNNVQQTGFMGYPASIVSGTNDFNNIPSSSAFSSSSSSSNGNGPPTTNTFTQVSPGGVGSANAYAQGISPQGSSTSSSTSSCQNGVCIKKTCSNGACTTTKTSGKK